MRGLGAAWCALCAAVLLAGLGLGLGELFARAWGGAGPAGPRATADAFEGQPDAEATLADVYSGGIRTRFHPFVHYRLAPFDGVHTHMDAEGFRRTPGTRTGTIGPEVWVLGGSTVWGMGARDEGTIPAFLARALGPEVRVENLGQVGYNSTQGFLTLLERLQAGRRPDVVIFYDGVNEVLPALKLGRVGVPLDVPRRELEFNLTRPGELPRLLFAAAQGVLQASKLARWVLGPTPAKPAVRVEDPDATAGEIVDAYAANVRAGQGLAARYGFAAQFFWQPTVFDKRARSPDEAAAAQRRAAFAPLYAATAARVRAALGEEVVDLTDVFGDDATPVFFDFCHLAEAGNRRVADAIAPRVRAALEGGR